VATEIGKLIGIFTAETAQFEAGAKRVESRMKQTADSVTGSQKRISSGELTLAQQQSAAASLQRQRSAALIRQWQQQERASLRAASSARPFSQVMQELSGNSARLTDALKGLRAATGTLEGPLGGIAGRLGSISTLMSELGGSVGGLGIATGGAAVAIGLNAAAVIGLDKALFDVARSAAQFQGSLVDLSQQTGVTVETLSTLELGALSTGGSLESVVASLGIFQRNLEQAQDPTSKEAKLLRDLGVSATDTEGALRQTIAGLAGMQEGFLQTSRALQLFGRGGKSMLAIAKEAQGDIDRLTATFRAFGIHVSTDAAQAADKFNDQLLFVQRQLRALTIVIGNEVMPRVFQSLREFSGFLKENRVTVEALAGSIGLLASVMSNEFVRGIRAVNLGLVLLKANLRPVQILLETISGATRAPGNIPTVKIPSPLAAGPTVGGDILGGKPLATFFRPRGGRGGGGGGRAESAAQIAAEQATQLAQVQLRRAEEIYRDVLDRERSFYDQSLSSLATYSKTRIDAENKRYEAEREVFKKEQAIITTGTFKPGEREAKQAELNQRIESGQLKHNQALRQITNEGQRERIAAQQRFFRDQIALQESSLQTLELQLRRAIAAGTSSAVAAEEARFDALSTVLQTRLNEINAELARVSPASERASELRDALRLLEQEIERNTIQHNQNMDDARRDDVVSAQRYSQAIQDIYTEIASINRDTLGIQLRAIEENTFYRSKAIRIRAQLEEAGESERHKSVIQELARRRQLLKVEIMDEYERARQIKAVDQQIEAERRNSAARQIEIQRQAAKEIARKWKELGEDVADIISAGMRGGLRGLLDEVKSVLDQISAELLKSAIVKLINPNLPNQGSQAGGLIGQIVNKILGSIGLGAPKGPPAGIVLSRGTETRPRIAGEEAVTATKQVGQTVKSASDAITLSQARATINLNQARAAQTQELVSSLNAVAEHICQCAPSEPSPLLDALKTGINAIPDLLRRPQTTTPTARSTVVVRDPSTGEILSGDRGGTRPRRVFEPPTVFDPQPIVDAVTRGSDNVVKSVGGLGQTMAQQLRANAEFVVTSLTPQRQGFWSGLFQAALQGAVSGLASGIVGGGSEANEGPRQPRPTEAPRLRPFTPRAMGGVVSPGEIYKVGEEGEELFVPTHSGTIIPHDEIRNTYQEIVKHITKTIPGRTAPGETRTVRIREHLREHLQTLVKQMAPAVLMEGSEDQLITREVAPRSIIGVGAPDRAVSQERGSSNKRTPSSESVQTRFRDLIKNTLSTIRDRSGTAAGRTLESLMLVPQLSPIQQRKPTEAGVSQERVSPKDTLRERESILRERMIERFSKASARQLGGRVSAGKDYKVGEKGEELFIPSQDGTIVHHDNSRNIYQQIATQAVVPETITKELKRTIERFRDSYRENNVKQIVQTITNNVTQDTTSKEIFSTIKSLIPLQALPSIKVALEREITKPEIHKETRIENVLRETINSLKTESIQPLRIEGRAMGGPVVPGSIYQIHNNEYFTPLTPGNIYNQQQMQNFSKPVVNNFYNTFNISPGRSGSYTPKRSAREIGEGVIAALQGTQR
jgi:hypothetical protein